MAGRRSPPGSYARLINELAPGGRLLRSRRLRGGLGARMHALTIERADGTRLHVSLRRFVRDDRPYPAERVAHEYRVLQLVEQVGIPAPRPLLLDAQGDLFGVPAIALSYLPGVPLYQPRDVSSWAEQLARALLGVHEVTPERIDLSWLSSQLADGVRAEIESRRERARRGGALAREVHEALEAEIDEIDWPEPSLVHDDFWPGNTVWRRGRLVGVIDWTYAEVGDPRTDVSQCRIDLAVIADLDGADAFAAAYQALAARPLTQVWYFDLLRGLRALFSYQHWAAGYQDAGLSYITAPFFRRRLGAFLRRALDERRGSSRL